MGTRASGTYDAVVIGARCAGATTAMLMARRGLRVLLVDRATFPSEIPHGHFIHRHGPARLARWGLLEPILATGCPRVTTMCTNFDDFDLVGEDLEVDGVPLGLGPRRSRLDAVLVEAATAAGAELREGFVVREPLWEDGRVVGVRGGGVRGGAAETARAPVVVGADGRNSGLAKAVGAPVQEGVPTLSCWYFSYWSGVAGEGLELHVRERRAIFAFPTNDDLFAVFVAWPIAELPAVRADPEAALLAVVARAPGLMERLAAGRREERVSGAAQLPNFLRRPYGPGWALVGDAGCHKDPYMALGVCDALRDAELLSDAVAAGLAGARPLDEALADYGRRRDEATLPHYRRNLLMAELGPLPPEQYALREGLRGDPAATRGFHLAFEEMVPAG